MPLPADGRNLPWPPPDLIAPFNTMAEHDAWYSGDPERIAAFFGRITQTDTIGDGSARWSRFWRRNQTARGQRSRATLHVPVPGDIAAMNASMLFGEEPKITIPEAHGEAKNADAEAAEKSLLDLADRAGLFARLSEAAEQCAAIGGVYLKIAWDQTVADVPIILPAQADTAVPEFSLGFLRAVTFYRVVRRVSGSNEVWRWLERYEPGFILNGLYKGSDTQLGESVSLEAIEATAGKLPMIRLADPTMLAVVYIPNMRPNRLYRGSPLGQSDYSGVEGIFDALDETYTSWMRDVRLAKGRLVVPQDYLNVTAVDGATRAAFDADREVYSPIGSEPGEKAGITITQFAIRSVEHEQTTTNLMIRAFESAGYNPQTFGINASGDTSASGVALRIRERRTQITRSRKSQMWQSPMADILHKLLLVWAAAPFNEPIATLDFRPEVELADGLPADPLETTQAVQQLAAASAASRQTLVRMVHPEWDQDQINAEVALIADESKITIPDPSQFLGGNMPGTMPANGPGADAQNGGNGGSNGNGAGA